MTGNGWNPTTVMTGGMVYYHTHITRYEVPLEWVAKELLRGFQPHDR